MTHLHRGDEADGCRDDDCIYWSRTGSRSFRPSASFGTPDSGAICADLNSVGLGPTTRVSRV